MAVTMTLPRSSGAPYPAVRQWRPELVLAALVVGLAAPASKKVEVYVEIDADEHQPQQSAGFQISLRFHVLSLLFEIEVHGTRSSDLAVS